MNTNPQLIPRIRKVSSKAAGFFTGRKYDFEKPADLHRAKNDLAQTFQNGLKNTYTSVRMVLDDKRYKAKNEWDVFWDSIGTSAEQVLTTSFEKRVKEAFDEVDIDNNGTIDRAELYAGMLLLYHKINLIPWGGRKPPPKRKFVLQLFEHYLELQNNKLEDRIETDDVDTDKLALTYKSFELLCKDHFETVVSSVLWRILLVTFCFPLIAVYLTDFLTEGPLRKAFAPIESALPTVFITSFVLLLPYVEAIVMRRLWADREGFAHFTVTPGGVKIRGKDKEE